MPSLKLGALVRGVAAAALMSTSVLSAPPVDLSQWSPEYIRSIAGTETYDTAGHCASVVPLVPNAIPR